MSTSHSTPGSPHTSTTTCYRSASDPNHPHLGPFQRCQTCHRTICPDCIGSHTASGGVICVGCSQRAHSSAGHAVPGLPWRQFVSWTGLALASLLAGVLLLLRALGKALAWLLHLLARPFQSEVEEQYTPGSGLHIFFWNISGETVVMAVGYLFVALALIIVLALGYGKLNDIPLARVIVAIAGAATFWAIVASQLLYWFRKPLGALSAKVFAFILAFFLAVVFGFCLINLSFLDKLFQLFS